MTWILLAEQEAATFKRVRAALASHGWFLKTVASRDEAFEVALEEPPRLVLVDESLLGAQDLVQAFASISGGPGVILVGDGTGEQVEADSSSRADAIVGRSFRSQELVELVRNQLSTSSLANPALAAPAQGRTFTTEEIFGDLLDDLLAPEEESSGPVLHIRVTSDRPVAATPPPTSPPPPTATRETTPSPPQPTPEPPIRIERDLDDTLAGVLAETNPGLDLRFARALEPDRASKEIDALLTKTLADLDISEYLGVAQAATPNLAAEPTPPAAVVMAGPASADQQRVGEYLLEEKIGVGGMAEVWMARRLGVEGFEKRVAIKKILSDPADNQAFIDMFIDEAKLAAQLTHNNITHIYELGRSGSDYFIAMEYVEGADLRKVLNAARKKDKPMPAALALLITAKIAAALDYAHRKKDLNDNLLGLVHRDVSPRNVLISHEGDVKLCDFGVAKAASKVATTQKGALKGKLPYMSPEQAWGKAVDSRSDIFSAGTLLFEMLTGQRLFDGESEIAGLEAVRDCEVGARLEAHPDIPSPVRAVLLEALAKSPDDRYQLAGDLQVDIEVLLRRLDSKPGDSELAAFIQEILQPGKGAEETVEDPGPPPKMSPLEKLTRPADPDQPGDHLQDDLEEESSILDMSAEAPGAWTRWAPWAVTAVFLILAFGAVAWWSFRPPRQPSSTGSGVESMAVGQRRLRPPFETGGAFHATDRSGAREAASAPQETDAIAPRTEPTARAPQPTTPVEDPIHEPPAFNGDAELQRQFEAELQRVEELLAASPLNGSSEDSSTAPTVAPPEPATPPATAGTEAESSTQEQTAPDISSDDSPPEPVEDAATPEPELEQAPATTTVAAPASTNDPPPEPAEDTTTPEPVIQRATDTAAAAVPASMPPPTSPAASNIATPASSKVIARSGVAKIQPDRNPTAPPAAEPTPAVKLGDLVSPGPGVVPPTPLEIPRPQYPPMARRLGVQGTVRMSLLVDEAGRVIETRLLEGVKQKVGINEAALAAAAKARFSPATKDGTRVRMWYEMVSRFEQ
ncbi:MAG: TonB family protein [Thermoanaerobaculia bacterium]